MQHIFVDLEMHPIDRRYSSERSIIRNEIIEFGAVMLDDDLNEISTFKEFVKPELMFRMKEKIKVLTGITQAQLASADKFSVVLQEFMDWCKSMGEDFRIYAWSENDLEQIQGELKIKQVEITPEIQQLMDNWEDFQKEYCQIVKAESRINLEKALNCVGIIFDGKMHDALWDARNTAQLYKESRDRDAFLKCHEAIRSRIKDEDEGASFYSLGDLFDFSVLNIA